MVAYLSPVVCLKPPRRYPETERPTSEASGWPEDSPLGIAAAPASFLFKTGKPGSVIPNLFSNIMMSVPLPGIDTTRRHMKPPQFSIANPGWSPAERVRVYFISIAPD